MQHVRALDANKDGFIDSSEFKRLLSADVIRSAAQWVDTMLKGIAPVTSTSSSPTPGAGEKGEDEEDIDIGIDATMNAINAGESMPLETLNESSATNEEGATPLSSPVKSPMASASSWKLASHDKYCVGERERHATELVLLAERLAAASNAAQDSIRESAAATLRDTLDEDVKVDGDSAVASTAVEEEETSLTAGGAGSDNKDASPSIAPPSASKESRKMTAMGKLKVP
jgi:hypothetical protein